MPTMVISHNWLRNYVNINIPPHKLAQRLSMSGLEVEHFEDLSKTYKGFVVGEIIEKQKHPNADRLTVCKVNVGNKVLQIVCGAPNVNVGQKVAVGLIGAMIPHNQHNSDGKPFILQQVKIRGIDSFGMICSEYELGLGDDSAGILVLNENLKSGLALAKALNKQDILYEIDITANRGDWMSHFGVARECSAVLDTDFKSPKIKIKENKTSVDTQAKIKIVDKKKCRRYCSRVLRNIKVEPSPEWLQNALISIGFRPINNIVDVTNYVMMETGQPLHAFDINRLAGKKIIVKCANDNDVFVTLDGKERKLTSETLMICDAEKPVAIAGVMGGANSEIYELTTDVLIESANFLPQSIRKTSKFLGLSTASSQRFERGVDIGMASYAANRAVQLIQELTNCEVCKGIIDAYPVKLKKNSIVLRIDRTNNILGTNLTQTQISSLLKRLQFQVTKQSKNILSVQIPTFRYDIFEEIDLIEEVARIYGYDNIETKTRAFLEFPKLEIEDRFQTSLREYLIGAGFNEIMSISLVDKKVADSYDISYPVILSNPLNAEMSHLRTNLAYCALQTVRSNFFKGEKYLRLFEIGNIFTKKEDKEIEVLNDLNQTENLLILMSGLAVQMNSFEKPRNIDIFDIKGEVEALLSKFCLDKHRFIYYDYEGGLNSDKIGIQIEELNVGYLGKIPPNYLKQFDIDEDVYFCEINIGYLEKATHYQRKYSAPSRFPFVSRDLAFIVADSVPQSGVESAIRAMGTELLDSIQLFDVYEGENIGKGKKNLAYALRFQPRERTLTDEEIDEIIKRIVKNVNEQCGGVLRS